MSKFCPILNRNIIYAECFDCDDKVCRREKKMEIEPIVSDELTVEEALRINSLGYALDFVGKDIVWVKEEN